MQKVVRKLLRVVANYDPKYYDMYADADEACFAALYLERIRRHADAAGIAPPARVLEAGCQAGRLVVPLAQLGFDMTGIDASGFALRRARQHAKAAKVWPDFIQGDVMRVLESRPNARYDLIICAEVLYLSQAYREILRSLADALRPGGLLCVSHRPKLYYLLEALRVNDLATAERVLKTSEGQVMDQRYCNWQTADELQTLYRSIGLEWVALYPIDRFAWLSRVKPSELDAEGQARWLRMEMALSGEAGTCARYLLIISRRSGEAGREEHSVPSGAGQ